MSAITDRYAPEDDRPLGGYTVLSTLLAAAPVGGLTAGRLPERLDARDVVQGGIATRKLSRPITRMHAVADALQLAYKAAEERV